MAIDLAAAPQNLMRLNMCRVGQNRIYTYIYTVYLVISKPKIPYVHRIYMVLANPKYVWALELDGRHKT